MAMAMGWRRIISNEFLGFLLLSLASFPRIYADSDTEKGECWYTVEVKTSKIPYSGTDDHVRVRIGDMNGTNVTDPHLSQPIDGEKKDPFGRGKTAKFNISGPCLQGEVCSIQFQVEGHDGWLVDEATVETQNNERYPFQFPKPFPRKTWDGYICGKDKERPSDEKDRKLSEKKPTIQKSCTRRRLLRSRRKTSKKPVNNGPNSDKSQKPANNGPNYDNPCQSRP
uniref:TSA: Wollemia nobilis Ref_Wollemi_Transcript_17462_761 transcribed RNA sequence n=1 Tax=Wollemia nobilis TaxID=56998 RepID=A0A0C9RRU4_9CONI